MSSEATLMEFRSCVSPPPAGPNAVDPSAPALTGRMLGVESPTPEAPRAPEPVPQAKEDSPVEQAAGASEEGSPEASIRPFNAEIDACEIDDRGRPETAWSARARELGRSQMVFLSRRMCYPGRRLVVLIHLTDHSPAPLYGLVQACEYEADGLYRVELRLLPMPDGGRLREWADQISSRR